jgi:predicted patatin/cPLA2 family phospholipase
MRMALNKYPQMIEAMDKRHVMYNQQLDFVRKAEAEKRCLVIRPEEKIPIGHVSHNPKQMHLVYEMGRKTGEKQIENIKNLCA